MGLKDRIPLLVFVGTLLMAFCAHVGMVYWSLQHAEMEKLRAGLNELRAVGLFYDLVECERDLNDIHNELEDGFCEWELCPMWFTERNDLWWELHTCYLRKGPR